MLTLPAPADSGPNSNGEQLVTQAAKGSFEIVQVVAENFAQCPDIKFVLFGYSYGNIEVGKCRIFVSKELLKGELNY